MYSKDSYHFNTVYKTAKKDLEKSKDIYVYIQSWRNQYAYRRNFWVIKNNLLKFAFYSVVKLLKKLYYYRFDSKRRFL